MSKMSNFLEQQKKELSTFENFMLVCYYPIIKESIKQQAPPKPDIFCKLKMGITIEFELTNSIDYQLAQKMNDERILDKGGFAGEPIEAAILEKNRKLKEMNYVLCADRFELLVYLGLMPSYSHWQRTIPKFLEDNKNSWGFNRIWVFQDDQRNPRILCSWPKEEISTNIIS